ncbi:MAG: hypothetical protein M1837_005564 [Sclerophora amabilis]|nr:MAG: hypothetical protein M1837_005564 [Sclerophora amabilis]
MAWRSSGVSNAALINNLASNGLIKSDRVKNAMLGVDRAHYAPASAYEDSPQTIGFSATISAPHMHAGVRAAPSGPLSVQSSLCKSTRTKLETNILNPTLQQSQACESLLPHLHPNARVLDIGSGSGYLTHVLVNLLGPGGIVVGVDHIQGLVDMANRNMAKSEEGRKALNEGRAKFIKADGRLGYPAEGPYDAIHVGAAAQSLHQSLVDQLKAPGRMFIPVESDTMYQHIWVVDKNADGAVEKTKLYGVSYVPLTDAPTK